MKLVAQNKKARHDYHIDSAIEAGMLLKGSEVKALRANGATLKEGYVAIHEGELFLHNVHIAPYKEAGPFNNHEPRRTRKLLLKRGEIDKLIGKVNERGFTLLPLKLYFNARGLAKVEIALAKGRRKHDKRDLIDAKEARREMRQAKAATKT